MNKVLTFDELSVEGQAQAGGKGGTLARLYQAGFPVPDGFIILPQAFAGDELLPKIKSSLSHKLADLRQGQDEVRFAVRSSALSEDSAQASFAGEFETVLDLRTEEQVMQAIRKVRSSSRSERVKTYSQAKGFESRHELAVVVQQMVDSEISGVLFSADPVSGNRGVMVGNFVRGIGDTLVSGETSGQAFKFERPTGEYAGPDELLFIARNMFNLAERVEREFGSPQDIEWAIADQRLYLLQSRPITTLRDENLTSGEWNASLSGDFLWSNVNFGEAVTSVMTPLSWTVLRYILKDWMNFSGYHPVGNICGRPYLNISLFATALYTIGKTKADLLTSFESTLYMNLPDEVEIPQLPLSRWERLSALPGVARSMLRQQRGLKKLSPYLDSNPSWCLHMRTRIQASNSTEGLLGLWFQEIDPHVLESVWIVLGSATTAADSAMQLLRDLTDLVGADDAHTLVSSLSTRSNAGQNHGLLLSLGPLSGLSKVSRREMARSEYIARYGHRGPDEFELSVPRPAEDPSWLDQQLAQFQASPVDVDAMLEKQHLAFETAWARLERDHPKKAKNLQRRIDQVASLAHQREMARSEYIRDRWVVRTFAVRAGELTGLGEEVFFLTLQEVLDMLAGDDLAVEYIPVRKETHTRYSALPSYPSIIRGCFDPSQWAADPHRRSDYFDAAAQIEGSEMLADRSRVITGAPGSAGQVEGLVRYLKSAEDGANIQEGEILVTTQTDIAWTLLFPRAAAIVTDVGAPLSHAAIVARELGIPAVVGCGDATMRLKTGDRVRVNGGRGVVEIL